MIRIKDYILNENDIRSIEKYDDYIRVDLRYKDHYLDIEATFEDIEWNYGTPQETQRQMQKELCKSCYYRDTVSNKLKELEEENKMLRDSLDDMFHKWELQVNKIYKAIEYINTHDLYIEVIDYDYEENPETTMIRDDIAKEDLLKILNADGGITNEIN